MSNPVTLKTRVKHKHDIPANWEKAVNFIPLAGEIIIYDDHYFDENGDKVIVADAVRFKVGDGVIQEDNTVVGTKLNDLPFSLDTPGNYVTLDTDQTISGNKTFSSNVQFGSQDIDATTPPVVVNSTYGYIALGEVDLNSYATKLTFSERGANVDYFGKYIKYPYYNYTLNLPDPQSSETHTLATQEWVEQNYNGADLENYVDLSTNQVITGVKQFSGNADMFGAAGKTTVGSSIKILPTSTGTTNNSIANLRYDELQFQDASGLYTTSYTSGAINYAYMANQYRLTLPQETGILATQEFVTAKVGDLDSDFFNSLY